MTTATSNQPRKKWASPAEKSAHYCRVFRERMKLDTPEAKAWREKQREYDRNRDRSSRRKDPEAARTRAMARKLADDNKARRARNAAEDARASQAMLQRINDRKRNTDALATSQTVPQGESVADFIARGGEVQVLPVNWQSPVPRRYVAPKLY